MLDKFNSIVHKLLQFATPDNPLILGKDPSFFDVFNRNPANLSRSINAAFLIMLCGAEHASSEPAYKFLQRMARSPTWEGIARFYLEGIQAIERELVLINQSNSEVAQRLEALANQLAAQRRPTTDWRLVEKFWSFTHPEATGIWSHEGERIADLRERRKISIANLNSDPIREPARQILFTANALLTLPPGSKPLAGHALSESLKEKLSAVVDEPQIYWYDHPVQIGVEQGKNEVLYGLKGLQRALDFERAHDNAAADDQLTCVLSVSVTHDGLHGIARQYLAEELQRDLSLTGLKVFVVTETDTQELIEKVLAPAASYYLGEEQAAKKLKVFGVDGEYGRHYTFLKAIAAFWQVLIDPQVKATFKIDLDQVFPQEELHQVTWLSAFEHLKTPLWGATGLDAEDQSVELGMIAGALVNEDDIEQDLFSADVPFPPSDRDFSEDEWAFFSQLPQALSTEAEMMARYTAADLDGEKACLQRIHVTGGTNGILVHSLRRYRPFTPSFIGRAEDQAFILSTFPEPGRRLAYLHQSGLIMRHDKQAFTQDAIQAAQVGKLIGDYVRILYFSAYAQAIGGDLGKIKDRVDPFTGSFISYIPTTLTLLRFALKVEALFRAGESQQAGEFVKLGTQRIGQALQVAAGDTSKLNEQYLQERGGWGLYYDTLEALEKGIRDGDSFAEDIRRKAHELINGFAIQGEKPPALTD
jgi:hypothetical protein